MTDRVRAFYEAHPYPPGDTPDCDAYQARLLLSYIDRRMSVPDSLKVLEAGCGRGINLTQVAREYPADRFTGIDINRVAIGEATERAVIQGLGNIAFLEADLTQSGAIPSQDAGYDVILSYGVLHHLQQPQLGLVRLAEQLAPEGVIVFMVDGRYAHQPLARYREALDLLESRPTPAFARALARVAEQGIFKATPWQGTAETDPVEFADRCLHVQETSFDIDALWRLLGTAGLRFIRWIEPRDWRVDGLSDDPDLLQRLNALEPRRRYQVIERLSQRPKLTLVAARSQAKPRCPVTTDTLGATTLALNPQLRRLPEGCCELRRRAVVPPPEEAQLRLMDHMSQVGRPLSGAQLNDWLVKRGLSRTSSEILLLALVEQELLYRPHVDAGVHP
ncbi:MAG: class I SAM-dependent methyltransferase [Candidatus Thiodiazotropha sp.]